MELRVFGSMREADEADRRDWWSRTPEERMRALERLRQLNWGYGRRQAVSAVRENHQSRGHGGPQGLKMQVEASAEETRRHTSIASAIVQRAQFVDGSSGDGFRIELAGDGGPGELAADLEPLLLVGGEDLLDVGGSGEPGARFHLLFELAGAPAGITDEEAVAPDQPRARLVHDRRPTQTLKTISRSPFERNEHVDSSRSRSTCVRPRFFRGSFDLHFLSP